MQKPGLTLNLGSGKDWREDCLNADIQASKNPDWVLDISTIPWGGTLHTRFGDLEIKPGMFETILANDVLEHIPDLVTAMTNCKELLQVGGQMRIHVPYDLSYGAWQDPTHVPQSGHPKRSRSEDLPHVTREIDSGQVSAGEGHPRPGSGAPESRAPEGGARPDRSLRKRTDV